MIIISSQNRQFLIKTYIYKNISMKRPIKQKFVIVFAFIVLAELFFMNIESVFSLHYFTKPLIIGSLIAYFVPHSKHLKKSTRNLTLIALVFSVIGDMLLMFTDKSPHYFAGGLVAFLLAHVMYILVFVKKRNIKVKPYFTIIFLAVYGGILFYMLKDGIGNMLIPVVVYMLAILTMASTAFWRKENVNKQSFYLVFIGALFFIISDSLIALDKFYLPIPLARTGIIITYAFAQLLIISGIIKQR